MPMDLVSIGEALIDFVAIESGVGVGEASGFLTAPGGAPANVAVGASRQGIRTAFLGQVGDDPFGQLIRQVLEGSGVDVTGLRMSPSARTGLAFVSRKSDGDRDFCFFRNPSADMVYAPADVETRLIESARCAHFGSVTLIGEPSRSATLFAIARAQAAGALISFDPNLRAPLWPSLTAARTEIMAAGALAHVMKVSEEEADWLLGEPGVTDATGAMLQAWPRLELAIVTRGAAGCTWRTRVGGSCSQAGLPVRQLDSTGAGDAFVAAMLAGLLSAGYDGPSELRVDAGALAPIMTRANAAGSLAVTVKGAIPALPTADAVRRHIARHQRT